MYVHIIQSKFVDSTYYLFEIINFVCLNILHSYGCFVNQIQYYLPSRTYFLARFEQQNFESQYHVTLRDPHRISRHSSRNIIPSHHGWSGAWLPYFSLSHERSSGGASIRSNIQPRRFVWSVAEKAKCGPSHEHTFP